MATAVAGTSFGDPFPENIGVTVDDTDDDMDALADELEAELVQAEGRTQGAAEASSSKTRKRGTVEASAEAPSAKSARVEREPQASGLATIPSELVYLILRWLSPEDLMQVAQTCVELREGTLEDSLWRRCYCARFGHPKQRERDAEKRGETRKGGARGSVIGRGGGGPARGSTWRALYRLEDEKEMLAASAEEGPLRHIFIQSAAAKRSTPPNWSALHTDDVLISTPTDAEAVARWRASRGIGDGSDPAYRHTCSLANGCGFRRFGADVFVCEFSGKAHVCDEDCRERVVDMDGTSEMCCVSGRSFDRILDEGAEGMTGERGAEVGDPMGERGFLGRCFEAGYEASSEREMHAALWGGDLASGGRLGDEDAGDSESENFES
jgi:hypothetical protein